MKRLLFISFCGAFLLLLSLRAQNDSSPDSGSSIGSVGAVDSNYILQSADVIQVEVYQEDDLEKMVRIEGDGQV